MANIFSSSKEYYILKDERFLYPDFVPERLPFRDEEISEMVFCLKPASEGKKPSNVFLVGKPGTGKTVTAKYVLNELSEYSDRVKTLYINCFELNSRHAILAKATNAFGYAIPPRGLSTQEIFDRFVALLKSKSFTPIFVLDEAEQLLKQEDTKNLLYDLSRLNEQYKVHAGLIFISNDTFFLSQLDDRIRSSLQASTLNFEKYSSLKLKEILKIRAGYAFVENALEEDVIPLCAAHAAKEGDARIAIDVLLKASRIAEKENLRKVKVSHVRKAFMQEKPIKQEITSNLSIQEKMIFDFVMEKEKSAGEIYGKFSKKFSERTLRSAIANLEQKNLIVTKKVREGKGYTRLISKK